MSDSITFSRLDNTGKVVETRLIKRSDIMRCPSFILISEHYREDGSCRHDEIMCEVENCTNLKFEDEIFCEAHI